MRFCSSCGHELGVGRFCTNCGQPVDRSQPRSSPTLEDEPAPVPPGAPGAPASPFSRPPAEQQDRPPAPDPLEPAAQPQPAQPQPPTQPPVPDGTEKRRAARLDAALTQGPPRTPPSADELPAPPRFPLYADEVPAPASAPAEADSGTRTDLPAVSTEPQARPEWQAGWASEREPGLLDRLGAAPEPATAPAPEQRSADDALAALRAAADRHWDERGVDPATWQDEQHGEPPVRRRWVLLVAAIVVLALLAAAIVWALTRGGGDDAAAGDPDDSTSSAPADLDGDATAKAPGNTPASQELGGARTTYVAANMLDGKPETAWRISGDAQGKQILFTFAEPVTLTEVGLINGYAKTAKDPQGRRYDWYHGHRTITKVSWVFDDGSSVDQELDRNRQLQTTPVDDVTTRTVTLRLLTVSKPGTGRASRDATAISDVSLVGTPAS